MPICEMCLDTKVCESFKECYTTWRNIEERPFECEDCEHPALPYEGMEEFFKGWDLTEYVDQLYGYELSDIELNKALLALFYEYLEAGVLVVDEDGKYIREYYEWAAASPDVYLRNGIKWLHDHDLKEFVSQFNLYGEPAARKMFDEYWEREFPHLKVAIFRGRRCRKCLRMRFWKKSRKTSSCKTGSKSTKTASV